MLESEKYLKGIDKIRRHASGKKVERILAEIRDNFLHHIRSLPFTFNHDLFNHFVEKYYREQQTDVFEMAEYLGRILDLLFFTYDAGSEPMDDEDWYFLRDLVNENAQDLDMEVITYIMKEVVAQSKFDL